MFYRINRYSKGYTMKATSGTPLFVATNRFVEEEKNGREIDLFFCSLGSKIGIQYIDITFHSWETHRNHQVLIHSSPPNF